MSRKFKSLPKCKTTKKTMFPTEKEAERARFRIWSHDPKADIFDLHVYSCDSCGKYHVGHRSYYEKSMEKSTGVVIQLPNA